MIAKRQEAPYRPGERVGMVKIKRLRTIDAVVRGWRPGKEEGTVGSLNLGLYAPTGACATWATRPASPPSRSASCRPSSPRTRRASATPASRAAGTPRTSSDGVVLRPELVVEVTFDHTSNERIRHGAKILRWRDDKDPRDCTMEQLDQ